jgi:hypothetical protein
MAKARKALCEMIVPGAQGWERWQAPEGQAGKRVEVCDGSGELEVCFAKGNLKRVLVLPVSHVWVMPAWLKGDAGLVKDMALLHLERLGIRVDEPKRALSLVEVTVKDEARLMTMLALKDEPTPLAAVSPLPDQVSVSAAVLPLAPSSITVWRELGRLVIGITSGEKLVYASPLTATRFDGRAIGELNNVCLQLGFQRVLGRVEQLVVWLPEGEGDLQAIERTTGLPVSRQAMPAWRAPERFDGALQPLDLHVARERHEGRQRTRVAALSAGLVMAAVVAVMMVMITLALREQAMLRDKVAEVSPRAARVLDQKRAWQEAAPALDPGRGPLQFLLGLQEPGAAGEVTLMHLEFTPQKVMLRGHTATASLALQYSEEIQQGEMLAAYEWEAPPPELAADESAMFELKGGRP